jgi:hypothetical protein
MEDDLYVEHRDELEHDVFLSQCQTVGDNFDLSPLASSNAICRPMPMHPFINAHPAISSYFLSDGAATVTTLRIAAVTMSSSSFLTDDDSVESMMSSPFEELQSLGFDDSSPETDALSSQDGGTATSLCCRIRASLR